MSVATSTAIGLGVAGAGLIGGVASSAIGAGEAGNAASTQANSANYAANLQAQEAQNSLNFQQQVYGQGQANAAPWLQSGAGALSALDYGLGITPQGVGGPTASPAQFNGQFGGQPAGVTSSGQPAAPGIGGATPVSRTPLSGLANRPTAGTIGASANTGLQPTSNLAGVSPTGGPASPLANGGALNPAGSTAPLSLAGPAGQTVPNSTAQAQASGLGFGSLLQGFQAPTAAEAAATPGYQFQLQQGEQAIDNGAAARGGLLSGNTLNAENAYGQGLAASNYQNTYNNAFNTFNSNQANQYNRLASLAGVGQTAASQLNSSGQAAASNIGNISQTAGQQIGQSAQNAGAATASGYVGAGNAINSGIGSATGSAQQGLLLSQLLNNNSNPAYNPYNTTGGG